MLNIALAVVLIAMPMLPDEPDGGTDYYFETGQNCNYVRSHTFDTILMPPVKGKITQTYRLGHPAQDISLHRGVPVFSLGFGFVKEIGYYPLGYGHYIIIKYAHGWETRYAHLMQRPLLEINDPVFPGDVVGYAGNTGYASGSHLHLEVMKDGCFIDPMVLYN